MFNLNEFKKVKNQVISVVIVNLIYIAHGSSIGWLSPSLPILLSDNSTLPSGPLSTTAAGWIGSVVPLGAVFGCILFGALADFIGCKASLIYSVFPLIISWILVIYAQNPWHIGVSRFLSGINGGAQVVCVGILIAEFADDHIRGLLSATTIMSFNFGILWGYINSSFLSYDVVPYSLLSIAVIFLVAIVWLPNTPQYLLSIDRPIEAEKSLRFYRNCPSVGCKDREEQVLVEFKKLQTIAQNNNEREQISFGDFLTRPALKGLAIPITLMAVATFSGTFALSNFASIIFHETGSALNANHSSIIMGCIQLIGTGCGSVLIDRIGRKTLLMISTFCGSIALIVTGLHSYLIKNTDYDMGPFDTLPIFSLSFFIFISAIGIIPVPFVLMVEVLPAKIKRLGASIVTSVACTLSFVMLKSFPLLLDGIQLYGCMWCFACVAMLGFSFAWLVVPETKGTNLDQLPESDKA